MDPVGSQLLEPFDCAYYVHQGVECPHFVEDHLVGGLSMYPPLSFAQQSERLSRPRANPLRQRRPFNHGDEVADAPMAMVMAAVTMLVAVYMTVVVAGVGRAFAAASRKRHMHLGGLDAAPFSRLDLNGYFRDAQPSWQSVEPVRRRSHGYQGAQQHVAANPSGRVDQSEATVWHRLINMVQE